MVRIISGNRGELIGPGVDDWPTVEKMPKSRSLKKDAEIAVIPGNPLVLRGARNVRTLSAAFIADLQEDWEKSALRF